MELNKTYKIHAVADGHCIVGNAKVLGIQDNFFTDNKGYYLFFEKHGEKYLKKKRN